MYLNQNVLKYTALTLHKIYSILKMLTVSQTKFNIEQPAAISRFSVPLFCTYMPSTCLFTN